VGAWIETNRDNLILFFCQVAPCVGAWIETGNNLQENHLPEGRALRGRVD